MSNYHLAISAASRSAFAWSGVVVIAVLASLVWGPSLVRGDDDAKPSARSELDDQLFRDLGGDLFDDLDLPDDLSGRMQEPKEGEDREDSSNEELVTDRVTPEQLLDDEAGDPLTRIGQLMREVQRNLETGKAEADTLAMQQDILRRIDELLKQQRQQSQNQQNSQQSQSQQDQDQEQQDQSQADQQPQDGQSSGDPSPQSQAGQSQEEQGMSREEQGRSQQEQEGQQGENQQQDSGEGEGEEDREDAEGSSDQLRERRTVLITPEEQDALIKEVWGNLPPHVRQQMSSSSVEGFLPKYEQLTQEYFRRLAEQKD